MTDVDAVPGAPRLAVLHWPAWHPHSTADAVRAGVLPALGAVSTQAVHHIVRRRCGATADVDCVVGAPPCLTADQAHGYAVDEAEIVFWGLCPACQGPEPHEERDT